MSQSKCEMARLRYCQKSYFGYCNADDTDVERCPYLKAIEEIVRLAVENSKLEDDLKGEFYVRTRNVKLFTFNRII